MKPNTLVERLRGIFRVPVKDGAGLLDGKDFFERTFPSSQLARDAADEIERLKNDLEDAQIEIRNLGNTGARGWQDISTAPKDGTEVLVYVPRRLGALYAGATNTTGKQWWSRNLGDVQPTLWQPLPTPTVTRQEL